MKKLLLLFILLATLYIQTSAQIEITSRSTDKGVVFDAYLEEYGTHTLVLKFTELEGYINAMRNLKVVIESGRNNSIYRLENDAGASTRFRYIYTYYRGKYNSKPDIDYPYLFPAATGKTLGIARFEHINTKLGKADADSILGIVFNYEGADTVCAIRSGQVVKIDHSEKERDDSRGFVYYDKLSQNVVTIEHADGSIARYICITAANILPKEGERIIAGQPIAVFVKEEERNRMGLHLYHLDKDLKNQVIKAQFYTAEGFIQPDFGKRYESVSTKEIIEKELSKKEKKKLNL